MLITRNLGREFIVAMVVLLVSSASGQVLTKSERKALEDEVAHQIDNIRKESGLRPLVRADEDEKLLKQTCTKSYNRPFLSGYDPIRSTKIIETDDLTATTGKLRKIAAFELFHPAIKNDRTRRSMEKADRSITRYSVAVWRRGSGPYIVGVRFYGSAVGDWFDNQLTDDVFYRNDWKKNLAPECRKIH